MVYALVNPDAVGDQMLIGLLSTAAALGWGLLVRARIALVAGDGDAAARRADARERLAGLTEHELEVALAPRPVERHDRAGNCT